MPFAYIAEEVWRWFADTGINVVLLVLLAFLVPRAGRFANRFMQRRVRSAADPNEGKSHLAISGVVVYVVQLTAYFLIFVFLLQQLGFSLAGAAIPATVVSAAIGFGAQSIIADFLAGFFILTEKQFGVGDHVEFQGNGLDIEGDVIQITMRATTIRTLNQATVTIPNSAARIYINQSNYWVNAVVVMPVPLIGSDSAAHAIERSERAARRALVDPEIASKLLGELQIHPAVEVNPPTAAGLPWTVDMRFMVRVEPLSQWMVERAIRIAVLDEFWGEYGDASKQFLLADAASSAETSHGTHHRLPRRLIWAPGHHGEDLGAEPDAPAGPEAVPGPESEAEAEMATEIMPARPAGAAMRGVAHSDTALDAPAAGQPSPGQAGASQAGADPATPDPATPHPDGAVDTVDVADAEAAEAAQRSAGTAEPEPAPEPRTVFGGAMRASTLALIIAFLVALLIRGMMLVPGEDTDASGGVLAPPARTPANSQTSTPPATEFAPAPAPSSPTETTGPGTGEATATRSTSPGATPGESTEDTSPAGEENATATQTTEPTSPGRPSTTAPAPTPGEGATNPGGARNPGGGKNNPTATANPAPAPAAARLGF